MFTRSTSLHGRGENNVYRTNTASTTGTDPVLLHAAEESNIIDVVIPANLLPAPEQSQPYVLGPTQGNHSSEKASGPGFDAREIALQQKQEVKRALERSTSVSVGALTRSRTVEYGAPSNDFLPSGTLSQFRKTSLTSRLEAGLRTHRQSRASERPDSTISEKERSTSDYFGNFTLFRKSTERSAAPRAATSPTNVTNRQSLRQSLIDPEVVGWRAGLTSDVVDYAVLAQTHTKTEPDSSRIPPTAGVIQRAGSVVTEVVDNVKGTVRKSSIFALYETAKTRGTQLQRKKWVMIAFEWVFYLILLAFVYFVLIGVPLWKGTVYWLWWVFAHKFVIAGTWSITIGIAVFYAYTPLFLFFEKDPPMPEEPIDPTKTPGVHNTALMIPCYKSEHIIGPTLVAATKIFPPSHIFVIANGNSPTPLDNTEAVCKKYGVNHVWSPVGSKIVAQFVGCYAAKGFKNVLLIDDDCALPPNFPIVSDRMTEQVKCIGYTIKSVGPDSSRGYVVAIYFSSFHSCIDTWHSTLCQQAQDLEYKISGIQRALAGKIGSATFPHGAISLWDSEFLVQTFRQHPGFSVSEDWFFGHVARELGSRIQMCTSVFIETETPNAVFFSSGGARGGFGEMTIFKQRFMRWNFFFVNGIWYNMAYIFGSWKLGWWELG